MAKNPNKEGAHPSPARKGRFLRCCMGVVLAVMIFLVGAVVLVASRLNDVVKAGIEGIGSQAAGVKVAVASVDIDPLSGAGEVTGLVVQSPAGFDTKTFLEAERAGLAIRPASLMGESYVVRRVLLEGLTATCETGPSGSNAGLILARLKAFAGSGTEGASASSAGLEIQQCIAKDLHIRLMTTGQKQKAPRVDMHLGELSGALRPGKFALTGLVVNNPPEYAETTAFSIATITIQLDPDSLHTDTIVIDEMVVSDIDGIYETSITGSNFTALQREIDAFEESMGGDKDSKYLIKNLYLQNLRGQLSPSLLRHVGLKPTRTFDNIHRKDVRSDSGAAVLSVVIGLIVPQMEGLSSAAHTITEGARDTGKAVGEKLGETFKKLGGMNPFRRQEPEEQPDDGVEVGDE